MVIITIGAGLIGWVAGEMLVADLALKNWLTSLGVEYRDDRPFSGGYSLELIAGAVGVAIVVVLGLWLARKKMIAMETISPTSNADRQNS